MKEALVALGVVGLTAIGTWARSRKRSVGRGPAGGGRPGSRPSGGPSGRPSGTKPAGRRDTVPSGPSRDYPGDFTGIVKAVYKPRLDGEADPGEIVWTWVPFEDDPTQGKDRPVLLIGRDGAWLLGLMLTSKDHSRDAADEARWGRRWMDIGSGDWDVRHRDSEVRLDRVIRIHPDDVRREGAVMDRSTFKRIVGSL